MILGAIASAGLLSIGAYYALGDVGASKTHKTATSQTPQALRHTLRMARKTKAYKLFATFSKYKLLHARRAACARDMPVLLDVVNLGLLAGLSFDAALELYCTRFSGDLAEVMSEAEISWRLGVDTRHHALLNVAQMLNLPTIQYFADAVQEALTFGSPLAAVLAEQAQTMRDEQRSLTEEQIERVPVKMLIPLGTLIVPAMLLAILGPLISSAFMTVLLKEETMITRFCSRIKVLVRDMSHNQCGQGTTEYAILVGVLVVIAIVAIIAFKDKISELWNAISEGINSL